MPRTRLDREVTEGAGFEEKILHENRAFMKCLPDSKTARFEVVGLVWFGFFATCLSCLYSVLEYMHSASVLNCVVLHAQRITRSEMRGTCQV